MVAQDPIAACIYPQCTSYLSERADQIHDFPRGGSGREIIERDIRSLRYHQNVIFAKRIDVVKRQAMFRLEHLIAGQLATQNLREDIVRIVGHRLPLETGRGHPWPEMGPPLL